MGTTQSDIEKVLRGLQEQGCTFRKSKLGYRVKFPSGDSHTFSASTEPRAMMNQRAVVRRQGLVWPLDPPAKTPKLPSPAAKATIPTPPSPPKVTSTPAKAEDVLTIPKTAGERRMKVNPTIATAWLEQNTSNRKLTTTTVTKYTNFMNEGLWHYDASPIRFAKNGRLLDGQHRLWAVIESGTTQEFLVVTGLDERSFITMDTGKKRGFADVVSIEWPELKDVNAVASTAVLVARWEQGIRGKSMRPSGRSLNEAAMEENLSFLDANLERISDCAHRGREIARRVPGYTTTMVALLLWVFEDIDQEDSDAFFERLVKGTNLDDGNPILALRNFLYRWSSGRNSRSALPTDMAIAVGIKAWNAFRLGRDIKILNYRAGGANPEAFPIPE